MSILDVFFISVTISLGIVAFFLIPIFFKREDADGRRALLYLYAFFFLKTCISITGFSYWHLESTNGVVTLLIRIAAFVSFQLFVSQFFVFAQVITKAPEDAKRNLRTKRAVIAYNVEQLVVFGIWLFLEGGTGSFSIARTIVTVVSYAFLLLTCVRLVTRRRFVASDRFRGTIIPIAVVMLALLPVSFALDLHVSLVLRLTTFSGASFPFVLFPLNFLLPILVILAQGIRQLHVLNHPRNAQIVANPLTNFGVSSREFEVIKLIREGHSNKEIAQRMGISPATVRNHVHNIFEKTAVKTREELRAFLEQQTIQT